MRVLRLAALCLVLAAAPAVAQTIAIPIQGNYDDVYVVTGRVVDPRGEPVRGGIAVIELAQEGVKAEPLRAGINCKGDFVTAFNLRHVDPAGEVIVRVLGADGEPAGEERSRLDPFYRRSSVVVSIDEEWRQVCAREADLWAVSASISARLLNRTEPYEREGETFHARPYTGIVRFRYHAPNGDTVCPPHPQNPQVCELFQVDERGDVRYTFTLDRPFDAGGNIEIVLHEGGTIEAPVDPVSRMAFANLEITGQGPPADIYETPAPAALALLALVAMALVLPRRR